MQRAIPRSEFSYYTKSIYFEKGESLTLLLGQLIIFAMGLTPTAPIGAPPPFSKTENGGGTTSSWQELLFSKIQHIHLPLNPHFGFGGLLAYPSVASGKDGKGVTAFRNALALFTSQHLNDNHPHENLPHSRWHTCHPSPLPCSWIISS